MARSPIAAVVLVLGLAGLAAGCTSDDGDPPSDPGGIDGPARVDPDADVNISGGSTDG